MKACRTWGGGFGKQNPYGVYRGHIEGIEVALHDLNKYGGELVDWMVIAGSAVGFIEQKVKRVVKDASRQTLTDPEYYYGELQPGEASFFDNTHPDIRRVCYDQETAWKFIKEIVARAKEQDHA